MTLKHLALVLSACALLPGCANTSIEESWKSTKAFYGNYINTPAHIDYDDKGELSQSERALSMRMQGVEGQLVQLERVMANADRPPTPESVSGIMTRFPWLAGVALLDVSGKVLEHQPPSLKALDFTPLLERESANKNSRGLRAMVQDTPLGPETMVAVPVYHDAEMLGLLVVHFDMRSLLPYAMEPGDLMILSTEGVLWPGRYVADSTPVAGQDWKALTKSNCMGTVSNASGEFLWVVRYIGAEPIIFAVPTRGAFQEDPEQLSLLGQQAPMAPLQEYDRSGNTPSTFLDSPAPHIPENPGVGVTPVQP